MRVTRTFQRWAPLLLLVAGTARGQSGEDGAEGTESGTAYGVELDARSRYVFRAFPMTEGGVTQITAWLTSGGFSFYAFGNCLLEGELLPRGLSETDFGAAYEHRWKNLVLKPELASYIFHTPTELEAPPTLESALTAVYSAGAVDLFTKQVVDVGSLRGAYYGEAGLSHERWLGEPLALAATVSGGWASARYNQMLFGLDRPAMDHVTLEISLTWSPGESLYLRPHVEVSRLLDRELRRHMGTSTVAAFGLAVGFERTWK